MRRALIALTALLMLAACGPSSTAATSPSKTATSTAKGAACQSLASVNQSLASLYSIGDTTTVGAAQATQQKVTNALNKLDTELPSGTGPALTQVQSANNQLGETLKSYPANTPIGQTSLNLQGFKTNVATAQSKATQLTSTAKCAP